MFKWIKAKYFQWRTIRYIDKLIDRDCIGGKPSKEMREKLRAIHLMHMNEQLERINQGE